MGLLYKYTKHISVFLVANEKEVRTVVLALRFNSSNSNKVYLSENFTFYKQNSCHMK